MNAVDIAILVVLAVLLGKGLWLGLIHELCGLIGLATGVVLAGRYHGLLATALQEGTGLPSWLAVASCYTLLFLLSVICFALLGVALSRLLRLIFLGGFNRVLGALFGLAQGVVVVALALHGLAATDWFKETRQASRLAPPFVSLGEQIMAGGRQLLQ
jgi:membrane protein required for colicin V production